MSIEDLLRLAEAYSSKNSSETGSDTYSEIESTGRMAVAGNAAAFLQKPFKQAQMFHRVEEGALF